MTAKNMKELEAMLMKEMRKSMHISSEKMLADMCEETGKFYTTKDPVQYVRTGALSDTPKITALKTTAKAVSFDAYLDLKHDYTTGKNPSMKDILLLASENRTNSSVGYLRPTIGKLQSWEDTEKKLDNTLNKTLDKFFDKL